MARGATYYFQIGFEHGYDGLEQSYPADENYADGHAEGVAFKASVHRLAPVVERSAGGTLTVRFPYVAPARRLSPPPVGRDAGPSSGTPTTGLGVCYRCGRQLAIADAAWMPDGRPVHPGCEPVGRPAIIRGEGTTR